jgi:hypothetical protein
MTNSEEQGTIGKDSTVDDWFGQDVQRDIEDADAASAEANGDPDRAEALFEQNRREHLADRFNVPAAERPD